MLVFIQKTFVIFIYKKLCVLTDWLTEVTLCTALLLQQYFYAYSTESDMSKVVFVVPLVVSYMANPHVHSRLC